ncbi:hypothetical protein FFLO_04736 [Filobasidium floriforme]|uniref:Uncharacterized protein n=1 Tax=Filobasidium floriforme TaxID=5210 RepID=A0A8K0JID0_9TREE|nr:hypothetical protein FFLO_04736 [Filobasidium floriforme]
MAALGRPNAQASASPQPPAARPAAPPAAAAASSSSDIQARIAALKAQVAAKNATINPYLPGSTALPPRPAMTLASEEKVNPNIAKKGGLASVQAHPLLADMRSSAPGEGTASAGGAASTGKGRYSRVMAPKFTSVAANARLAAASPSTSRGGASPAPIRSSLIAPSSNPYLTASSVDPDVEPDVQAAQSEMDALATRRRKATLHFNAKGKYIQQAEEQRKEAKMEELRQRIAEQSRKAGLDSEFDVLERNIKRQPPPEIEWWDAPLLKNANYNDLDMGEEGKLVRSDDSLVTIYVQHPVPLPPPFEGKAEEPRGLMLTKKEQKKMRRQRRAAELKDKQDRQRLGLLPMDPPKVKVANMMKVLTASAVQDPTKVEARVKAEAAARVRKHEQTNAERALTDEQKRERLEQKKIKEEGKGVYGCAFKIKYLVNGAHKFKIRATAEQLALHGMLIFHPDFALVYVEGSAASLKKYKRLLLVRIDWTEEARPKNFDGPDGMDLDNNDEDGEANGRAGWQPMQEKPESLADNKCEIVWEGELPQKNFRSFRYRNVESDRDGKEVLGKGREGVWDLAKKWIWEGVD